MLGEPVEVVARIAAVFDRLSIPYAVGGSLASSVYGIPRATQDADLVADLGLDQVPAFVEALTEEFYIDSNQVVGAIKRQSFFNVIHLATMFKVDIFVPKRDAWARQQLKRAHIEDLEIAEASLRIRFTSPEDTLLHKLVWYQLGDQVSDRQWADVLGILRIQRQCLDQGYLRRWAQELGIEDLLFRAFRQSGLNLDAE